MSSWWYILLWFFEFICCDGFIAHEWQSSQKHLRVDQALFMVNGTEVVLKGVSANCYRCDCDVYADGTNTTVSAVVDTKFLFSYVVIRRDAKKEYSICNGSYHFGEHGVYQLDVLWKGHSDYVCGEMKVLKKPDFSELPLVVLFVVYFSLAVTYNIACFVAKKRQAKLMVGYLPIVDSSSDEMGVFYYESMAASTPVVTTVQRLASIDIFRGLSIALMIFVNYKGGMYWFFRHSTWNGLTVADLVFPWFVFIMGSSIHISCRSQLKKEISKRAITMKILARTVKLLAIGLFLNNGFDLSNWRLPGVLQRLAICYLVVALMNLWLSPSEEEIDLHYTYDWRDSLRDLIYFSRQHTIIVILQLAYILVVLLANAPGCPTAYFGPGGRGDSGHYVNCTGGITGYIDRQVFTLKHIYRHPTCKNLYGCAAFDPEGLLGLLPSIFLTYMGVMASRVLFFYTLKRSQLLRLLLWSLLFGCVAIGLSAGTKNNGVIPINKNLWSFSFVTATGSMAFLLLAVFYYVVDVKQYWSGAPFNVAGKNAIFLYCGHEILADYFPFNFKNDGSHAMMLTRAAVGTGIWMFVANVLHRKKFYLKL